MINNYYEMSVEMVQEYISRLEKQGQTKEFIDGVLIGISWTAEFFKSMLELNQKREQLIESEHGYKR